MPNLSYLSQLKGFLGNLASVKGDLSNITAPPFILAAKSAIEIPASWSSRHALFLQPASEEDPAKRAFLIAKNYLCSLDQLVSEGSEDAAKKPLNPFLGELFLGTVGEGGETQIVAEQVSHHPPVTACYTYNKKVGICSSGFVRQETSFSPGSGVTIKQTGYAMTEDAKHGERHLMTMPTILVQGLATGRPYPELAGPCYIASSSGFVTKIEFEGKGKLGMGSKNRVEATIYESEKLNHPLYTIAGQWNGKLTVKDGSGKKLEEFDVSDIPLSSLHVVPISEQNPWESRRAWQEVVQGIKSEDQDIITQHKNKIEESQRARRADEKEKEMEWERMFFFRQNDDKEAKPLHGIIPDAECRAFDPESTAGVWKFVGVEEAEDLIRGLRHKTQGDIFVASGH